ncbi:hypothetical protein DPMN_116382 [Dreissena polymorpha]|uniref:Uncharacterized protein n=1 Tax=Dreissena polymorpha TaxID=45954 RepID=A0A9D4QTW7_DREPO|nr:hypothetical protein DPMN_116382 [Dreissena polymorpha]
MPSAQSAEYTNTSTLTIQPRPQGLRPQRSLTGLEPHRTTLSTTALPYLLMGSCFLRQSLTGCPETRSLWRE